MIGIAGPAFLRMPSTARRQYRVVTPKPAGMRFQDVVLPHLAAALTLARWLTGNVHDAEDVVQEACVRALAGIDGHDGRNPRAWVLAIVRNTCFSWLAKYRSKSLVMVGDLAAVDEAWQASPGVDEPGPTPEVDLIRKADQATIAAAIAALPHLFREVLVLRDISGFGYKEIAAILALPIGTVMSRLSRARALLAASIGRRSHD